MKPSCASPRTRIGVVASLAFLLTVPLAGMEGEPGAADPCFSPEDLEGVPEAGRAPTFTPYEGAPELMNADEVREAMDEAYPSALRDAGIRGSVLLHLFVDEDGTVRNAMVSEGSGHAQLDDAACRVAPVLRFRPAERRGVPVAVWIQLPLRFPPI